MPIKISINLFSVLNIYKYVVEIAKNLLISMANKAGCNLGKTLRRIKRKPKSFTFNKYYNEYELYNGAWSDL